MIQNTIKHILLNQALFVITFGFKRTTFIFGYLLLFLYDPTNDLPASPNIWLWVVLVLSGQCDD